MSVASVKLTGPPPVAAAPPGIMGVVYAAFFLSGVAGLGYQMVWARMFALGLGHEIPSVLAVVAAFFGGLAIGSWLLDRPIARSPHPQRWYVGLEALIGAWALLSVWLIPRCNELAFHWIGVEPSPRWHWAVAFVLPFACLLPATAAMGATLPAMERYVAPLVSGGRCVGRLYAINTAGAVAGTLCSAFVLMPLMGYSRTVWVMATVNFVCAVIVFAFSPQIGHRADQDGSPEVACRREVSASRVFATLFVTGLLGIAYEALGVRVMSQVLENTVYSFAAILSVYLLGTALGAALYQRWGQRFSFDVTLGYLVWGLAIACLLGAATLSSAKPLYAWARGSVFGDSLYGVMGCEMIVALAVFAAPTVLMGATFSHLVQTAKHADGGVGSAAAVNTLGGTLAPYLAGVVVLPMIGAKWALIAVSLGYLLLIPIPRVV